MCTEGERYAQEHFESPKYFLLKQNRIRFLGGVIFFVGIGKGGAKMNGMELPFSMVEIKIPCNFS